MNEAKRNDKNEKKDKTLMNIYDGSKVRELEVWYDRVHVVIT